MKVLNMYAGIGGNRKLWQDVEVTAVELNEEIAAIYYEYFPQDKVIVADAHEYLLQHYKEFDFIWSSRSCITHSKARFWASKGGRYDVKFPDFGLYEEIYFLRHFADCLWIVENVDPYYEPLLSPSVEIDRHLFWSNFTIPEQSFIRQDEQTWAITSSTVQYGFDLRDKKINHRKDQILRNLVNPEIGLYILEQAQGIIRQESVKQHQLF